MVPFLKYLLAFNTLAILAGSAAAAPVLDEIIVTSKWDRHASLFGAWALALD